jgi:radial spoke head protein 4A
MYLEVKDELPPDFEKRNEDGVNKNTYYVTNDLTGDWVELPDVRPQMLIASRKIRYIFTGNLNKKIFTNPNFPGTEKEYLKCQIVRIYHGTKIEPSVKHYVADQESPYKPLEKNPNIDEEKDKMQINDYLKMNYWIHLPPSILKMGRVSHYISPESADPDADKKKLELIDSYETRIKNIAEDKSLPSSYPKIKLPAWKLQYLYDDKIYTNPFISVEDKDQNEISLPKSVTASYVVVAVKSLRWPGAFTVRVKNENHFMYFGWGQKFADYTMADKFAFEDFPAIPMDKLDLEDHPEPNFPPDEPDANVDNANDNNNGD